MFMSRALMGCIAVLMSPDDGGGGGGGTGEFNFPPVVDGPEGVPKQYQSLYYKNEEGKFTLDPAISKKLDDHAGLRKAIDSERKMSKQAKESVSAWKALGDSPDEIKAKLSRLQELEEKAGEGDTRSKGSLEKIKRETESTIAQLNEEHAAQVREMGESLAQHLIGKEAISAISAAKGVPELLERLVVDQCVLLKEDGKYVVRVVDEEGDPRSDGRGGYLTIEGLVAELRANPKFARAFESSGRSGGGMPQGSGTKTVVTTDKLTPQQKIERGLSQMGR